MTGTGPCRGHLNQWTYSLLWTVHSHLLFFVEFIIWLIVVEEFSSAEVEFIETHTALDVKDLYRLRLKCDQQMPDWLVFKGYHTVYLVGRVWDSGKISVCPELLLQLLDCIQLLLCCKRYFFWLCSQPKVCLFEQLSWWKRFPKKRFSAQQLQEVIKRHFPFKIVFIELQPQTFDFWIIKIHQLLNVA